MVTADTGLPDPDNHNEEFKISNNTVINEIDDDSDQETEIHAHQIEYGQYQPLPTSPNGEPDSPSDDAENDSYNTNETLESSLPAATIPPIFSMESTLLKEVWSGPLPEVCDIKMDSQKVDEVKRAMLNITLPATAIPDWAANIPEDEWKHQLMKRLMK